MKLRPPAPTPRPLLPPPPVVSRNIPSHRRHPRATPMPGPRVCCHRHAGTQLRPCAQVGALRVETGSPGRLGPRTTGANAQPGFWATQRGRVPAIRAALPLFSAAWDPLPHRRPRPARPSPWLRPRQARAAWRPRSLKTCADSAPGLSPAAAAVALAAAAAAAAARAQPTPPAPGVEETEAGEPRASPAAAAVPMVTGAGPSWGRGHGGGGCAGSSAWARDPAPVCRRPEPPPLESVESPGHRRPLNTQDFVRTWAVPPTFTSATPCLTSAPTSPFPARPFT
jgi:hypothetical protein